MSGTADNRSSQAEQGNANSASSECSGKNVVAYPQDVLLAAVTLALTLSKGRSQYEVETLINLFSLTTNNLQSILAQMLINRKVADNLETPI